MSRTIFLSTVSSELGPLRRRLAALVARTKRAHVRHQDDFVHRGVLTLQTLEEEIRRSDVVLHVIGIEPGAIPPAEQVDDLLRREARFEATLPVVAEAARRGEVSYTQWEAWLALHLSCSRPEPIRLCIYQIDAPDADFDPIQVAHRDRLRACKRYPKLVPEGAEPFDELVASLIELGHLTEAEIQRPVRLPYSSLGPLFKGRDQALSEIENSLRRGNGGTAATAITAVHGLGGVGKTRLAVEYAWRHLDDYSALLFVNAESPSTLRASLAELTDPLVLNLPERTATEQDVQIAAALRWLNEHPGWLMILDNADAEAAATAVEDALTHLRGGHALITSRWVCWRRDVQSLRLDVLAPEAARMFLLERTTASGGGRGRAEQPEDESDAQTLAHELGQLALALEQAGAYIVAKRISLGEYVRRWRGHLDEVRRWHDAREMQYPASLAVTWRTTLDQLTGEQHALLNVLAWFAPDPLRIAVLEGQLALTESDLPPTFPAPARARDDLAIVADFSMVSWDTSTDTVTMNRVVQEVLRSRQDAPATWLGVGLLLLDAARPEGRPDDVRAWPTWDLLAPHIAVAAGHAHRMGLASPTSDLMGELGVYYSAKARHDEAETVKQCAFDIDAARLPEDSPQLALRMNNLAQTLRVKNRLAEAETLMRRALAIEENAYGAAHAEVARSLNNLAMLLQERGRPTEAEPLMRRALDIVERAHGARHPVVATALTNLGQLLHHTGQHAQAEPLIRRALAINSEAYPDDHPEVATALNNLAILLRDTDRPAEAEPLMRRALRVFGASLGGRHPATQLVSRNYGALLIGLGVDEAAAAGRVVRVQAGETVPDSLPLARGSHP